MRLRIIISWAPYPEGSIRAINQQQALDHLRALAPEWCDFALALLPGEKPPDLEAEIVRLPREGSTVTGGHTVPYLRDMLAAAFEGLSLDEWGGIFNSDILVTPEFFEHAAP